MVKTTEEKILEAARKIFLQKGMDGARMQEIANEAGINKSLLHYYFKDKETLFSAVFSEAIKPIMPALAETMGSDRPLLEKIQDFFMIHMGFIQQNPMIPHFIMNEAMRNPQMIIKGFSKIKEMGVFQKFDQMVKGCIARGEIKPIEPMDLIINMLSISIFPFLAKPVLKGFFDMTDEQYDHMLEARKKSNSSFIVNSLS
jgi:AcrR family transcriptional regulator